MMRLFDLWGWDSRRFVMWPPARPPPGLEPEKRAVEKPDRRLLSHWREGPTPIAKQGLDNSHLPRNHCRNERGGKIMKLSKTIMLAMLLGGSACSVTEPVVVISQNGQILKGSTTASLSGGVFSVSNGVLTCAGNYDSLDTSTTISMPVTCSDGRRGIIIAVRDNSGLSGSGSVRLSDGSTGTFLFGSAAAGF